MQSKGASADRERVGLENSRSAESHKWLYILIAYYGFEYLRLQDSFFPFLSPLKIPMLLTLILTGYVLVNLKHLQSSKSLFCILIFWILIVSWVPFATNNHHAFQTAKSMSMVFFSCLATILIVDSREKFRIFFNSLTIFLIVLSFWIIYSGGNGPGGFLRDENDAALIMVCALPLVFYRIFHVASRIFRNFLVLGLFSILVAVVVTYSRGGLVGLVAVIGFMIWLSRKRWRNIFVSMLILSLSGGISLALLPQDYVDDMSTITNKEDGTRNLRLLHWTTALEIFKDNPVLGVGPENYPWTSNKYLHLSPYFKEGARFRAGRQAHSLYFTLIPELGLVGIITFFLLIFRHRSNAREIILKTNEAGSRSLAKAIYASLVGFLAAGAFISVLYYPIFWHLIFVGLAFHQIETKYLPSSKTQVWINGRESKKADFNNHSRA